MSHALAKGRVAILKAELRGAGDKHLLRSTIRDKNLYRKEIKNMKKYKAMQRYKVNLIVYFKLYCIVIWQDIKANVSRIVIYQFATFFFRLIQINF